MGWRDNPNRFFRARRAWPSRMRRDINRALGSSYGEPVDIIIYKERCIDSAEFHIYTYMDYYRYRVDIFANL